MSGKVRREVSLADVDLAGTQIWGVGYAGLARASGKTIEAVRKQHTRGGIPGLGPRGIDVLAVADWARGEEPGMLWAIRAALEGKLGGGPALCRVDLAAAIGSWLGLSTAVAWAVLDRGKLWPPELRP